MAADLTDRPLLVTAVGGAPGFDLARVLQQDGYQVIGADAHPLAAGLFLPGITSLVLRPSRDDHYLTGLLEICRTQRPAALIATDESEILRLLGVRDQLSALGVRTWLPSRQAMTACHDKAAFHHVAREHDIATPRTWLPEQIDQIPAGVDLVVKPRRGHGGKNVQVCRTAQQARVLCELVDEPLLQEHVDGTEFTADVLIDHHGGVSVVLRRRLVIRNGLAVAACTFHDDQVAETVTATVAALGMTGLCCVQGFVTAGPDRVLITEVNGRVAGAFPISIAAGADLIGQFLNGLFGQPVDHDQLRYTPEVYLIKYVETLVAGPTPLVAARPVPGPVPRTGLIAGGTR